MLSEAGIARRYLRAQKSRTALLALGVVLAVALISTLFSMLGLTQQFEVRSASASGVWHVLAADCTSAQAQALQKRLDVSASGRVLNTNIPAVLNGRTLYRISGADAGGLKERNLHFLSGNAPQGENQIALENWVAQKVNPGAKPGAVLTLTIGGKSRTVVLSGILKDNSDNKSAGIAHVWVSLPAAQALASENRTDVFLQVRNTVSIESFVRSIEKENGIPAKQVTQHTMLLAALGRSGDSRAAGVYGAGGVLAALVLFAATVMIYNAFNQSVAHRVRQYGLLRAVGATPAQIRRMVRAEALQVSLLGVLPGVLLGVAVTAALNLFLQKMLPQLWGADGPVFFLSWPSLLLGAVLGVGCTLVSAFVPTKKAGGISPVQALSASSAAPLKKRRARGFATRLLPVEFALSLRQIGTRKRSFALTALSLSFGILLLLAFSPMTDLVRQGARHNFEVGDVYAAIPAGKGAFSETTLSQMRQIAGVSSLSAKRVGLVDATFAYRLLGDDYRRSGQYWGKAQEAPDGTVRVGKNRQSVLVGLSDSDLRALQGDLVLGKTDPAQLDRENGVLLMLNTMSAQNIDVSDLKPGDTLRVSGKTLRICGVVQSNMALQEYAGSCFIGMYTTNRVFESLSGAKPNFAAITLKTGADGDAALRDLQSAVSGIPDVSIGNQQQMQETARRLQNVTDVFFYGFIAVIGLIGLLNIVGTIGTSVLVRTRQLCLLRAGGMTMGQVTAMLVCEAAFYGVFALAIGLLCGVPLHRLLYRQLVQNTFGLPWHLPWGLITAACALTAAAVFLALISPLRRVKKLEITQAVTVE